MTDPINAIAQWLESLLKSWGLSSGLVVFIMSLIGVVVIATAPTVRRNDFIETDILCVPAALRHAAPFNFSF